MTRHAVLGKGVNCIVEFIIFYNFLGRETYFSESRGWKSKLKELAESMSGKKSSLG